MTQAYSPAGLDHDRLREIFLTSPFIRLLDIRIETIEPDRCVLRLPFRDDLLQPGGLVHGGAIASLVDSAAAIALFTGLERPPKKVATIDLHMSYLNAVRDEDLLAEATVRRRGRSVVYLAADVTTPEGRDIAHAELVFRVVLGDPA
ncbi:MAG: PaaI family thioesterase [Acidobacteriota bacterium]